MRAVGLRGRTVAIGFEDGCIVGYGETGNAIPGNYNAYVAGSRRISWKKLLTDGKRPLISG